MTSSEDPGGLTYRDSGVDIEAGDALVEAIKPLARATIRRGAIGSLGGFGSLFDTRAAGFTDPILVATTDGVGTKLRLAIETGIHDTVGIDLVAMCVNDLIVQGAEPLFFLDCFATGHLDRAIATRVIAGISEACRQVGCTLSGGETAEMPGMYRDNDYVVAPRFLGDRLGLSAAWVIFALFAGAEAFGFLGILLAVPVTATLGVLARFWIRRYQQSSLYLDPPRVSL